MASRTINPCAIRERAEQRDWESETRLAEVKLPCPSRRGSGSHRVATRRGSCSHHVATRRGSCLHPCLSPRGSCSHHVETRRGRCSHHVARITSPVPRELKPCSAAGTVEDCLSRPASTHQRTLDRGLVTVIATDIETVGKFHGALHRIQRRLRRLGVGDLVGGQGCPAIDLSPEPAAKLRSSVHV